MRGLSRLVQGLGTLCLWAGMAIILVQSFWITWGVFARYVLGDPDPAVTEATALLLVPLALLGLPEALRSNSFPQVSFLLEALPAAGSRMLAACNLLLMTLIGGFFGAVTVNATVTNYRSGASSQILGWPEYLFWLPSAAAVVIFVLASCVRLIPGQRR